MKVFELSFNDKTLSPNFINKVYHQEQIDLLLFENHYCLIFNLRNFFGSNENNTHLCRRYLDK